VLIVAIAAITNTSKGYNNVFGSTFLAVKTDSMAGDKKDNFESGDLIVSKLLSAEKKTQLEKGDVITFWTLIEGKRVLNTHRIESVEQGSQVAYITKGDANLTEDPLRVLNTEVVGKYQFKLKGMGSAMLFFQSSTGFLIFVVIPSVLALAYCVFLFIRNLKGFTKLKKEEQKEKLKAEFLEEMNSNKDNAEAKETKEG
ncbi:MAG: signal peptidase I, partial [Clostridia bacterium]|nr:signal peptidase I [Clostridia bacterium]